MSAAMALSRPGAETAARAAPPGVEPFRPAAALDPGAVPLWNRLVRPRRPWRTAIEGLPLEIGPVTAAPPEPLAGGLELRWTLARAVGEPCGFSLVVPAGAVERVLAAMQPDLVDPPEEPALSLLVELALAPLLEGIEARLGASLALSGVGPGGRGAADFALSCDLAGGRVPVRFAAHDARSRTALLEAAAALAEAAPPAAAPAPADATVIATFSIGSLRLALGQLASLRPGDVLLPDRPPFARGELAVVLGGRRAATARMEPDAVRLASPFHPIPEPAAMDDATPLDSRPPEEAGDLGDVEVGLTFELGRQAIAVSDLAALAPGYVFDLKREPAVAVDILAHGRRIGRGEIVKVGDALGVRIVRLAGREG